MEWILQGNSEHIVRASIKGELGEAEPLTLITAVMNHFVAVATIDQQALIGTFGFCLEASKEVYRRMLETGDYAGALRAIKQIKDLADQAATLQPPGDEEDVRNEGQGRQIREEENPGSGPPKEDGGERP